MHLVGDLYAQGYIREYFRGENELAVMSEVAGASMGGVRVFTATGGPGTLRAFEMFSTWSGARLPIVCAFMTRGINSPLTIQPDNIEMAHMLDTGMIMLHAENAQDVYDMLIRAFTVLKCRMFISQSEYLQTVFLLLIQETKYRLIPKM